MKLEHYFLYRDVDVDIKKVDKRKEKEHNVVIEKSKEENI